VWLEHVAELNDTDYGLKDLSDAHLSAVFPCIMHTDGSNVKDMSNWSPAFLRKVRKRDWEVFDEGLINVIEGWSGTMMTAYKIYGERITCFHKINFLNGWCSGR
jgi:hypothetical protein